VNSQKVSEWDDVHASDVYQVKMLNRTTRNIEEDERDSASRSKADTKKQARERLLRPSSGPQTARGHCEMLVDKLHSFATRSSHMRGLWQILSGYEVRFYNTEFIQLESILIDCVCGSRSE
jgi:hypothetical protein